jgi:hypothetical protein
MKFLKALLLKRKVGRQFRDMEGKPSNFDKKIATATEFVLILALSLLKKLTATSLRRLAQSLGDDPNQNQKGGQYQSPYQNQSQSQYQNQYQNHYQNYGQSKEKQTFPGFGG